MRAFVIRWIGNAAILLIVANAVPADSHGHDAIKVQGLAAALRRILRK